MNFYKKIMLTISILTLTTLFSLPGSENNAYSKDSNSNYKGKIGVLMEEYFDEDEYEMFIEDFTELGYKVEFISRLWGNEKLTFTGLQRQISVDVTIDVDSVNPKDYKGFILIGGYAMDRLRYQEKVNPRKPNDAPAVNLMKRAFKTPGVKIGTICHSLWLLTGNKKLLKGKKVTCASNIIYDVKNTGAKIQFKDGQPLDIVVHKNLISAKHPQVLEKFIEVFVEEIEKEDKRRRKNRNK